MAAAVLMAAAVVCGSWACRKAPPASRKETIWRPLGSWSGRGNLQSESFPGESGGLRVRWKTTHAEPASRFQVTVHSAISGRPLQVAVTQEGDGEGTAYVVEDPRVFFTVVESAGLDWQFTVEEPVDVILTPR